jgi:hypothetical protein
MGGTLGVGLQEQASNNDVTARQYRDILLLPIYLTVKSSLFGARRSLPFLKRFDSLGRHAGFLALFIHALHRRLIYVINPHVFFLDGSVLG